MELRLQESRSTTLDSNGTAVITSVGPVVYGETWKIERISVNTTSRCKFTVHRGDPTSPTTQIDGTVRGDLDTSETSISLLNGESIAFKWANGAAGAIGTVVIEGTRTIRGR